MLCKQTIVSFPNVHKFKGGILNSFVEEKTIELNELLQQEGVQGSNLPITENDVIVIPKVRLSEDDIEVIKKIRANNNKVYIHNLDQTQFKDFRGGEYVLGLLILKEIAIPIVMEAAKNWVNGRITSWKKRKQENQKSEIKPPDFKMEFYVTDKKKYMKIEGDSETSLKALDKLKDL